MQVTKEMKKQYLEMLPLANASESILDNLNETETEVGNLVWVCESVCSYQVNYQVAASHTE